MKHVVTGVAAIVALLMSGPADAFRPSSRWLLDESTSRQLDRGVRNLRVEAETQLFDAGGAPKGASFAEHILFASPQSVRRESELPEGVRVELRDGEKLVVKQGTTVDRPARAPVDVVADFFTLGGSVTPDGAIERLQRAMRALGVNPEIVSLARFDGRIAYLVGSKPWELDKPQLWLDKDSLLLVRVVQVVKAEGGRNARTDVRLLGYGSAEGGNWFPKTIETWIDDRLARRTTTRTVDKNVPLDAGLLDARKL